MTQQPIVTIQEGKLRGKIATDYRGGQYFSFQGIPYAKPPIGNLRFKAPQSPDPWLGIRDATVEGSACYHRHMSKGYIGSEDCLFLNVYTPELPKKDSIFKPVMVWIHGGGFKFGSGDSEYYGPEFLLPEDVVVVTINYRIGLLGFLSLEDLSLGIPGNAGLKDQVLALKWVQNNIEKFSGSSNNVTVFGQSAGGASVHYLMLSPMARGLFHRAIIQSGTAFDSWSRGQPSAPLIATALGLKTSNEKEILNELKKMSVEQIYQIQNKLPDKEAQSSLRALGIVIEKDVGESSFLTTEPIDLVRSGKFNKVPLIIGYTSREGVFATLFGKYRHENTLQNCEFEKVIPYMLKLQNGISKNIAQKIKKFYYGDAEPSLENIDQYYLLLTDTYFLTTKNYAIRNQIMASTTPIYFYRMSLDTTLNWFKKIGGICYPGAGHADDICYLFKNTNCPKIRPGSIEDESIRRITKLWTTFARNGDPNPIKKDPLINITWKPVQKGDLYYLEIGENLTVGINPDASRMAFWDDIFSLSSTMSRL